MTPIYYLVHDRLDRGYKLLDRDKIEHWLFHFKKNGTDINDSRGGRIRVGGNMLFDGSVRDVTAGTDRGGMYAWLDKFCGENPTIGFIATMTELIEDLRRF